MKSIKVKGQMISGLQWAVNCLQSWIEEGKNPSITQGMADAIERIEMMIVQMPEVSFPDAVNDQSIEDTCHPTTAAAFDKVSRGVEGADKSYAKAAALLKAIATNENVNLGLGTVAEKEPMSTNILDIAEAATDGMSTVTPPVTPPTAYVASFTELGQEGTNFCVRLAVTGFTAPQTGVAVGTFTNNSLDDVNDYIDAFGETFEGTDHFVIAKIPMIGEERTVRWRIVGSTPEGTYDGNHGVPGGHYVIGPPITVPARVITPSPSVNFNSFVGNLFPFRALTNGASRPQWESGERSGSAPWTTDGDVTAAKFYALGGTYVETIQPYIVTKDSIVHEFSVGYDQGDGGLLRCSVQGDSNGFPDGVEIGTTKTFIAAPRKFGGSQSAAAARYPGAVWSEFGETGTKFNAFRKFSFVDSNGNPTRVYIPEIFHIVFHNATPDADNHHVSINYCSTGDGYPGGYRKNNGFDRLPGFPQTHWNAARRKNGVWNSLSGLLFQGAVGGDVSHVQARYEVSNTPGITDRIAYFSGDQMIRERIVLPEAKTFRGIELFLGRIPGGTAPVRVRIHQGGSTLLDEYISDFPELTTVAGAYEPGVDVTRYSEWRTASGSFSTVPNTPIYIELSTSSGTRYDVSQSADGSKAGYFNGYPNPIGSALENGYSETSSNGGGTWVRNINNGSPNGPLDIVFWMQE
ncbi:hypothetical protein [uncultured Paraglaciecola sp.]|uniref:hypothetical protein n=1 Tax=uncultured Paraglaciecola sp. TaxID=1765024 RepID=UPI0026109CD9|nr:hypothetical protein [uncultured Paraglaciecola sp.]